MTYAEFKAKYQEGHGLSTSTKIGDAYRQYRLKGTLPAGAEPPEEEEIPPEEPVTEPPPTAPPTTAPIPLPEVPPITIPTIEMPPAPTPPPMPEVPTVPPYEPSPEQVAWEAEYAEELAKWREAGGYGIPEEVQTQMIQRQTDILKAREQESIRVMRNNMESRGITNSGFVFANEMTIKSNTTLAIANSITDVQINSAMMKLASFEKAMGATAQFIGYLAEESWKTFQPKMAQWEMEARYGLAEYEVAAEYGMADYQAQVQGTLAQFQADVMGVMAEWQAKFDLIKMELNQAYTQGNINLSNQWAQILQDDQQEHEIELAEWELKIQQEIAAAAGAGQAIGGASGIVAALIGK